jgi:diguanylate cyclase (GGDEF)-like protein
LLIKQIINNSLNVFFTIILLLSAIPPAHATNNEQADQIIKFFNSNKPDSPAQAQELLQTLKYLLNPEDASRFKRYISAKCWHQNVENAENIKTAISFADEQLKIYQQPTLTAIGVELRLCKAKFSQLLGQLELVIAELDIAIKQAYSLEDIRLIAHGRSLRGYILSFQGDHSSAIKDLIVAQRLFESLHFTSWANANLGELAASYRRFGDATTALKYQLTLEQNYLTAGKYFDANNINIQIASSYEQLGDIEKAILRYQKSQIFLAEKQPIIAADMSVSIANNLLTLGKNQQALKILQQAEHVITAQYSAPYSFLQLFLAKTQFSLQNYPDALTALQKAKITFELDNNQRGLSQALLLKSKILEESQDWHQAYLVLNQYLFIHAALDESLLSKQNLELQARFDTDRIKDENILLIQISKDKEFQLTMLQRNKTLQMLIIALVATVLLFVSIFAYKQLTKKHQFKQLALTDELTNLSNRRATYVQAKQLLAQSKKDNEPFSIISFDADNFKLVNDKYGHDIGDEVLVRIAGIASDIVRNVDTVGRVGGEEFLILLPNNKSKDALTIANRLLSKVAQYDWSSIAPNLTQTVSAGVVSYQGESELSMLLIKADKALYSAKNAGRNTVIII